jgi:hypothetical protein
MDLTFTVFDTEDLITALHAVDAAQTDRKYVPEALARAHAILSAVVAHADEPTRTDPTRATVRVEWA